MFLFFTLQNLNTYVLLSIKKYFFFGIQNVLLVVPFLEMLVNAQLLWPLTAVKRSHVRIRGVTLASVAPGPSLS